MIKIRLSDSTSSSKDQYKDIAKIVNFVSSIIQKISVKHLYINDQEVRFELVGNEIAIKYRDFQARVAILKVKNQKFKVKIKEFKSKSMNFFITADLEFDLRSKQGKLYFDYNFSNIDGSGKIDYVDKILDVNLYSNNFSDMTLLEKFLDLGKDNKELNDWIFHNIKASNYKINKASLKFDTNSMSLDTNSLMVQLQLDNVQILFNKKLQPIKVKKLMLNIKNNRFFLSSNNATYHKKPLKRVNAYITNLLTKNPLLGVELKLNSYIDKKIIKILKAYDINIPINQTKSPSSIEFKLKLSLSDEYMDIQTKVKSKKSRVSISNLVIDFDDLEVIVNNSKIKISSDTFYISNKVKAGINLDIDTKSLTSNGMLNIKKLLVTTQSGRVLVDENYHTTPIFMDFNDEVLVEFEEYHTLFAIDDKIEIIVDSFLNLNKQVPLLKQYSVKDGVLMINTTNFDVISGVFYANAIDLPLFNKDFTPINSMPFSFLDDPTTTYIDSDDGRIKVVSADINNIEIKDIDIDLDSYIKQNRAQNSSSTSTLPNMSVKLKNIGFKFHNNMFDLKQADIKSKDDILKSKIVIDNSDINITKKDGKYRIKANNITHEMMNKLLNSNSFIDGKFKLDARGTPDIIKGHIDIYNTTIKNMTLLNNIFAFINTIPAILTFDFSAGYNSDGYYIKKGGFDFTYSNKSFFISNIKFKSDSFNIKGNGAIGLEDDTIDMSLNIEFLKGLSNKNISISGKLDNPDVSLFSN